MVCFYGILLNKLFEEIIGRFLVTFVVELQQLFETFYVISLVGVGWSFKLVAIGLAFENLVSIPECSI